MTVQVESSRLPEPPLHMRMSNLSRTLSQGDEDDDNVVGLGVPHGDADEEDEEEESEFISQEQDEHMTEMILKHRSQIQRFVERTIDATAGAVSGGDGVLIDQDDGDARAILGFPPDHDNLQNIPPSPGDESAPAGVERFEPGFRTPQPTRSKAGERLMQLSRTERTDRMRLAELSEVGKERLGRAAILRWNPHAKLSDGHDNRGYRNGAPVTRERSLTTPPRTTAKMLGEISKDYVQQALDFNHPDAVADDEDNGHLGTHDDNDDGEEDDDDDDLGPPSPSSLHELLDHQPRGARSAKQVRKYVKHMETTIAQLVQQKGELLRNQAEFDKHASGMFPTLETLNNQLSQIVQDRMLQSQVNIRDDLDNEMRVLRVRLNELESDAKQRRDEAEAQDQQRQLDIQRISGEIASLSTTGSLQNQRLELASDQIKHLQQEFQQLIEVNQSMSRQIMIVDHRVTTVQTAVKETAAISLPQKSLPSRGPFIWVLAVCIVAVSILMALLSTDRCSGLFGRCHPLT